MFAHQHLDQLTPALRAAVAANTSIKLAGGVSDKDARAFAADMRTTPDFIAGMAKHAKSTEFACYVRNYTTNAVRLTSRSERWKRRPRCRRDEHARLIAANRERYAAEREQPRPAANGHERPRTNPAGFDPSSPDATAPPTAASAATPNETEDWRS